jgi:hypothetical protein
MGGATPGMASQPMGSIGHMTPGAGIQPAGMPNRMGLHLGMHPASVMPKRDDGGAVGLPAQPAPTPGLQPNTANANPLAQSYIQRFASMNPEQLQELVGRLNGSPLAGIAQRVLQQKRLMPTPTPPAQTAQPTALTPGAPGQPATQQQPTGMQPAQPIQQAARGGQTKEKPSTVPILAAGGEFIVSPEHVARMGDGDIKEGHRRLDQFVIQRRAQIIKEMKALRPPVGSKSSKRSA